MPDPGDNEVVRLADVRRLKAKAALQPPRTRQRPRERMVNWSAAPRFLVIAALTGLALWGVQLVVGLLHRFGGAP